MELSTVSRNDIDNIVSLVKNVAECDVLPLLSDQGKSEFITRVLDDLELTLDGSTFLAVKAVTDGELIGFGALRNGNYLTHLFVSKQHQGMGIGKLLLDHLIASTNQPDISLRSSVNAASFYEQLGFVATGGESEYNGIRFVPMQLNLVS
ncbi:GNAT family N-acetyltransferase [Vibrio sp. 10N]|uniref:GNAT family N-acetyltransferase n=1 Tax=Vibrio sp. 10N TaxID=3058938 RepID=UPI0030C6E883